MAAVASRLMAEQQIASDAVMKSDARAIAAEGAAVRVTNDAQNEVLLTRDQARQALSHAERAYAELQSRAHLAQQSQELKIAHLSELAEASQNRFNSEEVLARTWEHSFNESVSEGKAIRVQACQHVEDMQALHDRKLQEAASKVKKAESRKQG